MKLFAEKCEWEVWKHFNHFTWENHRQFWVSKVFLIENIIKISILLKWFHISKSRSNNEYVNLLCISDSLNVRLSLTCPPGLDLWSSTSIENRSVSVTYLIRVRALLSIQTHLNHLNYWRSFFVQLSPRVKSNILYRNLITRVHRHRFRMDSLTPKTSNLNEQFIWL